MDCILQQSLGCLERMETIRLPALEPASDALSEIPVTFPYTVNEQNVNRLNYEKASTAIGGDYVATKLWWDKFQ